MCVSAGSRISDEAIKGAYLNALQYGVAPFRHVRVFSLGLFGAGKSSLLRALRGKPFLTALGSTCGLDVSVATTCLRADYSAEDLGEDWPLLSCENVEVEAVVGSTAASTVQMQQLQPEPDQVIPVPSSSLHAMVQQQQKQQQQQQVKTASAQATKQPQQKQQQPVKPAQQQPKQQNGLQQQKQTQQQPKGATQQQQQTTSVVKTAPMQQQPSPKSPGIVHKQLTTPMQTTTQKTVQQPTVKSETSSSGSSSQSTSTPKSRMETHFPAEDSIKQPIKEAKQPEAKQEAKQPVVKQDSKPETKSKAPMVRKQSSLEIQLDDESKIVDIDIKDGKEKPSSRKSSVSSIDGSTSKVSSKQKLLIDGLYILKDLLSQNVNETSFWQPLFFGLLLGFALF